MYLGTYTLFEAKNASSTQAFYQFSSWFCSVYRFERRKQREIKQHELAVNLRMTDTLSESNK